MADKNYSFEHDHAMYKAAVIVVRAFGRASESCLQSMLNIGFNRANSLLEAMEVQGVVSARDLNGIRMIRAANQTTENP